MDKNVLSSKVAAEKSGASAKNIEGRELDGFDYDKSKAKVLKSALHSINVALGTLMSATKDISMIRGSEITPDGKLGGKGFIMSFKDIKKILNESVINLSDVTDTLADELTNPMWGLSAQEKKKVKKEQEVIEDQVEDIEDVNTSKEKDYDSISPEDENEEDTENEESDNLDETKGDEDTAPEDDNTDSIEEETVKGTGHRESNDSYREMMSNDKTASVLSKRIMANLLTGMKKNG